jgi:transcriptional antiterminator RfaH
MQKNSPPDLRPEPEEAWYCVRTQYHRESMAEHSLREVMKVECLLPRIRYRKARRQIVEPLFPGYLFARFSLRLSLRKIHYCEGVSSVVHFGKQWPSIPAPVVEQLRKVVGTEGIRDLSEPFQSGDQVEVLEGPFQGFEAVVSRVVPAQQRICVLLECLGRQTAVQVSLKDVRLTDGTSLRARQPCLTGPR